MIEADGPWVQQLLRTWFEELDQSDWFEPSADVDAMLRRRFADVLERLGSEPPDAFLGDPRTAQAAILLFDQIPRNIFRDDARAYAWDRLAQALAHGVIARGWLDRYDQAGRQFALMPLMHSEDLSDQQMSLELFARHAPDAMDFARSHHEMIARFGRFPHRNALLGRKSSDAEAQAIADGFSW